ncbi:hypothetical protein P168DRAFT_315106 [Aspergillus campestris IBT 28561]|uniref:Zn(2)-C6 fungal-type domain-containing protein n=1 Tax=Aspergillus campestris (strain IBT 28561) TaxID=1392248 RepID=A0A2I1DGS5_ASPC2|nr:uncharacterized protein P168DRAFT_315106 [Aspergillus campestris IBT 28561]PKY09070.1 hypothetical protein P168DRAFT_315106 [Aspergillus campestris IBT 28561]
MSRQPKLRPKSYIPGFPDAIYDLSAVQSLSQLESRAGLIDDKHDQRVFRVKRKHVLKACDRCRVKKTKCDGKQPCNRCSAYNHPCLFRERKATQTKVYSRGFVEMLESHHSLVVKALQKLYKLCLNQEGFPGSRSSTEESHEDAEEDTEDLQFLRLLSTSTDSSAASDPSPEPATPPDPSPITSSPVTLSPRTGGPWKWEFPPVPAGHAGQYQSLSQPGFQGISLSRPSLETAHPTSEAKMSQPVGPVPNPDHHYPYYENDHCNGVPSKTCFALPGVSAAPGFRPATTAPGMPVDMLSDYALPMADHQAMYPTVAPGWNYPCG